jgi:hypothetical protein
MTIHVEFEQETRSELDGGREREILADSLTLTHADTKSIANVKISSSNFYP